MKADLEICGDCSNCQEDYLDHLLYHRALHTFCKFCGNLEKIILHFNFIICESKGYYPDFYEDHISASRFRHTQKYIDIEKNSTSSKFSCDKCEKSYERKTHLKRHQSSSHFGEKVTCSHCGLQFARKGNLYDHIRSVHEGSSNFQCFFCNQMRQLNKLIEQILSFFVGGVDIRIDRLTDSRY